MLWINLGGHKKGAKWFCPHRHGIPSCGMRDGKKRICFLPSDVTHIPLDDSIIMDINDLSLNTKLINEDDAGRNSHIYVSLSTALILNNGAASTHAMRSTA